MAIPNYEEKIDETYKMVHEAFFEGFNAAEEQYKLLIEYVEELDKKSVEAENRHYIKIYADDEPSVKAEKLYQICGETQNKEVTEWLKEYFPLSYDNWIPVSERLPKKGEVVLITNGKGNVRCGQYRSEYDVRDETHYWWWKGKTVETVLAWMPLPKPYREEDEE